MFKGERNEACSKTHAEKLASQLSNAEGGAVIYTVKGLDFTPPEAVLTNVQLRGFWHAQHYPWSCLDCEPGFWKIYFSAATQTVRTHTARNFQAR